MKFLLFILFCVVQIFAEEDIILSCQERVPDGEFEGEEPFLCSSVEREGPYCAEHDGAWPDPSDQWGFMMMATIVGAIMAFGIGANDAANAWSTTVGSGAIKLEYAVILGGCFEWIGAVTLGYGVSSTISKGVSKIDDPDCWGCGYCDNAMGMHQAAMFSALFGAGSFLMLCSRFGYPVSTTHSIVGGVVGVTIAGTHGGCLNWEYDGGLGGIIASWFISPVFSGLVGLTFYFVSEQLVLNSEKPYRNAKLAIPILYTLGVFGMVMMGVLKAKAIKKETNDLGKGMISLGVSVFAGVCAAYFVLPVVDKEISEARKDLEQNGVSGPTIQLAKRTKQTTDDEDEQEYFNNAEEKDPATGNKVGTYVESDQEIDKDQEIIVDSNEKPYNNNNNNMNKMVAVIDMGNIDHELHDGVEIEPEAIMSEKREPKVQEEPENEMVIELIPVSQQITRIQDLEIRPGQKFTQEQAEAVYVFRYLLVFMACLESIAHGSNDTANATGPFTAVYQSYRDGLDKCDKTDSPVWIMVCAGFFVFLGITLYGRNVIRTIGSEVTILDFHKAFYIEFGSTAATIVATYQEMPVSTTHCQVGALVFVGAYAGGRSGVAWLLFAKIALGWILTLPLAGGAAAIMAAVMKASIYRHY